MRTARRSCATYDSFKFKVSDGIVESSAAYAMTSTTMAAHEIRKIQWALASLGYHPGAIDGRVSEVHGMTRQTRKTNPGDAANAFVRAILSDAGAMLGGLTEDEWRKTLEWFEGRCAYTGLTLDEGELERDHAIPMNRAHCGLHLYGNVVPATKAANRRKAGKHYREFIEDRHTLERIDEFLHTSRYWERVSDFGDLQRYCEAQYRAIDALCRVNRKYLASLRPPVEEADEEPESNGVPTAPTEHAGGDALPIVLEPSPASAFKTALLRQGHAWIVEIYRDGRREIRRWNAARMSESSNIVGNLRSRPRYRKDAWEQLGLKLSGRTLSAAIGG